VPYPYVLRYVFLAAGALATYFTVVGFDFAFDDFIHVTGSSDVRTLAGGLSSFTHPLHPGNLYRPLTTLSYALTYKLFGLSPVPYHVTNLLLHITVVLLFFGLLSQFKFAVHFAFPAALLFALNPIHSEVVCNISARSESLAALFGLVAIGIALQERTSKGSVVLYSIALLLAFLSKESALAFGFIVPLIILWSRKDERKLRLLSGATLVSLVLYLSLRFVALGGSLRGSVSIDPLDNPLVILSGGLRFVNAIKLLGDYALTTIFPFPLQYDYSAPVTKSLSLSQVFAAPTFYLACTLLFLFAYGIFKKKSYAYFLGWFFAHFLIAGNLLFPVGTAFALRLLYVPSIGLLALLSYVACRHVPLGALLSTGLAVAYGALTFFQVPVWANNTSLFTYEARQEVVAAKSYFNLAMTLRNKRESVQAKSILIQLIADHPQMADSYYGLGLLSLDEEKNTEAFEWFKKTLHQNPDYVRALVATARILMGQKEFAEAEVRIQKALMLSPRDFEARTLFVAILLSKGNTAAATSLVDELLLEAPTNPMLLKLRLIL